MSGYANEPKDLPVGAPYWFVQGQYNYYLVEERCVGETGGQNVISPLTKKAATTAANELNRAYRRGLKDAEKKS